MKRTPYAWFAIFALAILVLGCNDDDNSSNNNQPVINSVTPASVAIGQRDVNGQILGSNLNGVTAVSLGDGINVNSFQAASANQINVNFSVHDNTGAGARTVSITTATGGVTSSSTFSVANNKAPRARFTVDPPAGSKATVFNFDATNSVDPSTVSAQKVVGYGWNFGDGATANGKKVKHKFATIGNFTVTLTVTDGEATDSNSRQLQIKNNAPPVAKFSILPSKGSTLTNFHLDGSRSTDIDGRVNEYRWDFGDGKRANGEDVFHTYSKQGDYDVTLTVIDNRGERGSLEKTVAVEKSSGQKCNSRGGLGPAGRLTVLSTPNANTIIARFEGGSPCSFFYRCGDVRKGGLRGWGVFLPEKWIGVMCEFIDLGNGTAQIKTVLGNYNPVVGDKLYTWPQLDCTTRVCGQ